MRSPVILIADDFVDAATMYSLYLRHHGFEVVTALDGHEAIEAARRQRPDVVLLDLRMPGMSGTEAMKAMKADDRLAGVPILALTAHAMPDERRAALAAGFDDFLSKPIAPQELVAKLKALLQHRTS
jgi:two-component system response regulator MtrA